MKKLFLALLAIISVLTGCGKSNVIKYVYKTSTVVEGLILIKSEYTPDSFTIYHNGTLDNSFTVYYDIEIDDNTLTYTFTDKFLRITGNQAGQINKLTLQNENKKYELRYLDTNQYKVLSYSWATDYGWSLAGGEEKDFYTKEEIAEREAKLEQLKVKQDALYEKLKGIWTCDDDKTEIEICKLDEIKPYIIFRDATDSSESYDENEICDLNEYDDGRVLVSSQNDIFDYGWTFYMDDDWKGFTYNYKHYTK